MPLNLCTWHTNLQYVNLVTSYVKSIRWCKKKKPQKTIIKKKNQNSWQFIICGLNRERLKKGFYILHIDSRISALIVHSVKTTVMILWLDDKTNWNSKILSINIDMNIKIKRYKKIIIFQEKENTYYEETSWKMDKLNHFGVAHRKWRNVSD